MSIRIVTDSGADLESAEFSQHRIELVPLGLTIDGRIYSANQQFNKADFFRLLEAAKVFPKTSQPAPSEFETLFEDARQKGDQVIYLSIASALSGTYQTATVVKGLGEYDNVFVVDSRTATLCQKLLVLHAAKLRDQGKTAEQIVAALEQLRSRVRVYAGLDTLEYLRKGGRLGRAAASLGTLARIKPVVTVGKDGSVQVAGKCMGIGRAMKKIQSLMEKNPADPDYPIYGMYSGNPENTVELLARMDLQDAVGDRIYGIGPIIGAHIGPGAYGIVYVEKES